MEFVFALPFLLLPVIFPFITGQMAKGFGRKFWPWFLIGIPLPIISNFILLCLPDKSKKKDAGLHVVENEEIFDPLFINTNSKNINENETDLSATA